MATSSEVRFRLVPGWLAVEQLLVPTAFAVGGVMLVMKWPWLRENLGDMLVWLLVVAPALLLAARLPMLAITVFRDGELVIDDEHVHVPRCGLWHWRPWDIPFANIRALEWRRRGGGSTRLAIVLGSGRVREISAGIFADRYQVMAALTARLPVEPVSDERPRREPTQRRARKSKRKR